MTFLDVETSVQLGTPVELYKFTVGSVVYRYTSSEYWYAGPDTIDEATRYTPLAISRTGKTEDSSFDNTGIKVTMPSNAPFARIYRTGTPSVVVTLNVFGQHWEDPAGELIAVWNGRVISPEPQGNRITFGCESLLSSMNGLALRRHYQKSCPHVLYGTQCGASEATHQVIVPPGTFYASGSNLVASSLTSYAAQFFAGGYVRYTNALTGVQELRAVRSSSAGTLVLSHPAAGLAGTLDLKAYPGCKHTAADCTTKFNNLVNYGGQLYIPSINPFNGAILY